MKDTQIVEKLEDRVRAWADSYDSSSDYTEGKKIGAIYAVRMLEEIIEEAEENE